MRNMIAKIIKEHRITAGISHEDLSKMSGVSPRLISRVENADANITIDNLSKLLLAIDLEINIHPKK